MILPDDLASKPDRDCADPQFKQKVRCWKWEEESRASNSRSRRSGSTSN